MSRCLLVILVLISIGLPGCSDNLTSERLEIIQYLENNGLQALDTLGIFVVINNEGSETKPVPATSTVKCNYIGKYLDGSVFDQSIEDIDLKLSTAINGLQLGLPFFGKNGTGLIIIPSNLGFGTNPPLGVRKNAILIFDIVVKDF